MKRVRRRFYTGKYSKHVQYAIHIFYQVLGPLIVFQFIRTLFFPTTFDMFLLTALIIIYLVDRYDIFEKK